MSSLLQSFDPTAKLSGTIQTNMGTNPGILVAANHSGVTLILTFPDGTQKRLWAQSARLFKIDIPAPFITWQQDVIAFLQGGYNRVDMELYGLGEEIAEVYPIALTSPATPAPGVYFAQGKVTATTTYNTFFDGNTLAANIGNFPFSNVAIANGLAVAGTVYFLIYSYVMTLDPFYTDGTTIEKCLAYLRLYIQDSSGANVSSWPSFGTGNGEFVLTEVASKGGEFNSVTTLAPSTPIAVQTVVSAGAGPPYKIQAASAVNDTAPAAHFPSLVWSVNYGITAATPPALQ